MTYETFDQGFIGRGSNLVPLPTESNKDMCKDYEELLDSIKEASESKL